MSEAGIRIHFQLSFFISNLGCTTGRLGPCGIHIMGRGARPFREVAAAGGLPIPRGGGGGGGPPIPGGGGGEGARAFREVAAAGGGPPIPGGGGKGGGPAHSGRRWRGKWSNPLHWRRDGRRVIEDVTIHFAGAVKKIKLFACLTIINQVVMPH